MSTIDKLYIAGIGMVSALGSNTAMTSAAVKAGISGYAVSNYYGENNNAITMANIPNDVLAEIDAVIDEGNAFCERHYRVTLMAIAAVREACSLHTTEQPIPLLLAMPDVQEDTEDLSPMIDNIETNCEPWVSVAKSRSIYSGRAAGMEAIDFAFRFPNDAGHKYILVGGSDSYQDYDRITPLAEEARLMEEDNMDGFAPGEAASFLLLTSDPTLAMVRNDHVVALRPPGIANELGHLHSNEPYKGEGLDNAFKKALAKIEHSNIDSIYSSMNGENHWAKEFGVAYMRNKAGFTETVNIEHPADVLGDVGSATSTVLIALAAEDLYKYRQAKTHLVYSSSDTAKRGAIVLEKISVTDIKEQRIAS